MWNTLYYYVLAGCLLVADAKLLLLLKVVYVFSLLMLDVKIISTCCNSIVATYLFSVLTSLYIKYVPFLVLGTC